MTTPIEDRASWALHRATRDEMRTSGYCAECAEQIAFAVTDLAEGVQPRAPKLCAQCRLVHENGRPGRQAKNTTPAQLQITEAA